MFDLAESKIEIVSYHWGLQKGSGLGKKVYDTLAKAVTKRHVRLEIIHTTNKTEDERYDTSKLYLFRKFPFICQICIKKGTESLGVLNNFSFNVIAKHFLFSCTSS